MYQLFWSSSVYNSCPNLGSFFNSPQSDLLSDLVYLGLKLPDLFRSESFRSFMPCFHTQYSSIHLDLVFFWPNPSFSLCFGHLQGTAPMLYMKSGATVWTKWAVRGATTCNPLARSGDVLETLCQHLRSAVLGRHHSKALFPHFFCKNLSFVAFSSAYQTCVIESDVCGLIILWFKIDLSGISKVWLGLLIVHPLLCLLVVFTKGFLVFWKA